jgi:hypothetical protein
MTLSIWGRTLRIRGRSSSNSNSIQTILHLLQLQCLSAALDAALIAALVALLIMPGSLRICLLVGCLLVLITLQST